MLRTDWRLTWKNPVDLVPRVWLEKRCYFATPQFQKKIPLHIPFLAHDSFRTNIETRIRQFILQHRIAAIPLFLSTHRLREQGFSKLSEILHNHRRMEGRWKTSHIQNLPCCYNVLRSIAKQHIHKTYVFPFPVICSKAVTRWLKHHGLPPQLASAFLQKIIAQWKLHFDAIDNIPIFLFMLLNTFYIGSQRTVWFIWW